MIPTLTVGAGFRFSKRLLILMKALAPRPTSVEGPLFYKGICSFFCDLYDMNKQIKCY